MSSYYVYNCESLSIAKSEYMKTSITDELLEQRLLGERIHAMPTIPSNWLFAKNDEVLIAHQGAEYRLRRTRNGKLILTK